MVWFKKLKPALLKKGFINSKLEACLFILHQDTNVIFVLVYVDDILITRIKESIVREVIQKLSLQFPFKILRSPTYFLGLEIQRNIDGMHIC